MQAIIILGSMCALVAHTATAEAAPAWCKGGDEKPSYDLKSLFTEADADRALDGLVAASCYPEADVASMAKQIEATRAVWSRRLGLTEADWADVSEYAHQQRHMKGNPRIAVRDRQAAWSAYSPIDQYGSLMSADTGDVDAAYLADAFGTKLTQLGRLGYVVNCLEANDAPVRWAMCASDIAALDMAKLAAEIRSDTTHSATDRMTARIVAYETLSQKVPKHLAETKAVREKEPAYEKMWTLAAAAHVQWSKTDARWIALADSLDAARVTGSRAASKGCIDKTWDAWKTVVGAIPAKELATIQGLPGNEFATQLVAKLASEPNSYLVALALNECATLEGKDDELIGLVGYGLVRWPGFRGPRTAGQTAILTAGLELDDRNATIDHPKVHRDWIRGTGNTGVTGQGAIESVKIDTAKDQATITFAKKKITQQRCVKGHYTNRISQILDGTIHYYYVCDKEITETIEVPPSPPLKVGARYATGLKPGMTVSVSDDFVSVAYPPGKTVPTVVTGVEVK